MKSLRSLLAALFTGASATAVEQPKPAPKAPAEMMREMRLQWLTRKPPPEAPKEEVAAVLMDWPIEEATVTVLASSVGDASVYTTGSFGILGGIGHENARKAALSFIECAKKHLRVALPTTDFSYPDRQHVRFFFVTDSGVRILQFAATDVQKTGTEAYDLYAHGQAVLTEMRQITQEQRGH
jgi:hypothetical protein